MLYAFQCVDSSPCLLLSFQIQEMFLKSQLLRILLLAFSSSATPVTHMIISLIFFPVSLFFLKSFLCLSESFCADYKSVLPS